MCVCCCCVPENKGMLLPFNTCPALCLWDESICLFVAFFLHVIFNVHMMRVLVSCAVSSSGAHDLSGGGAVPAGGSIVRWPAGHGHGCADHVHWDPCLHSGCHVEEETQGLQQPPQWELDPFFSWPTNLTHYRPTGARIAQLVECWAEGLGAVMMSSQKTLIVPHRAVQLN